MQAHELLAPLVELPSQVVLVSSCRLGHELVPMLLEFPQSHSHPPCWYWQRSVLRRVEWVAEAAEQEEKATRQPVGTQWDTLAVQWMDEALVLQLDSAASQMVVPLACQQPSRAAVQGMLPLAG